MGLDTVELVIRFEDAFGITFPNEVASQLTTPREVVDYVMTQVVAGDQPACLSQQSFYFLREMFTCHLRLPRKMFRPDAPLEQLIPKENRRTIWASLRAEAGVRALPALARPLWVSLALSLTTALIFVYAVASASKNLNGGSRVAFFFGLLAAAVAGYSSMFLTRPFKNNFRRRYEHFGDLAKYLALDSPHTFKKQNRTWTREQVAQVVREIIVDETGRTDFTEDSHFINDMHLD